MTDLTQELETLEKELKELLEVPSKIRSAQELLLITLKMAKIIGIQRLIIKELEQKNEDLGYQILEAHEQSQQFESD